MATVSLKLLVDTGKNRVVFAESEKDFVDILFSFLTLPMGTIIRVLDKRSSVGCMDKLYESVENLNPKYLETEACKAMLLQPRSAAEQLCEDLHVNADDLFPRRIFRCRTLDCFTKTNRLYSSICGARCHCGKAMDESFEWLPEENGVKNDVFLKGEATYIISDDLHVLPATVAATLSLLQKLGMKDAEALEERIVDVDRNEVLRLLKSLLRSKRPFTDAFLPKNETIDSKKEEHDLVEVAQIKLEAEDQAAQAKKITVKLLQNKITKKILYAEAGDDLVDVLLSFLTFPLGSIVKLLNKQSSLGCVDNLYNSVDFLAAAGDYIKSGDCKNMLLAPKLYPHFNCSNQVLRIQANISGTCNVQGCKTCWYDGISASQRTKCERHNIDIVKLTEINPKMVNSGTEIGGGYSKKLGRFMVTDEMVVTPLSPISGIGVIKELKVPISSLVEKEVSLGEAEVLNLLKACLVSSNLLSNVFSPPNKRRKLV